MIFTSREHYGNVRPPHIHHGMMDKGWKCGGKPFNIYSWSILNFWILKLEANHSFSSHCFLFKCSFPIQCFWWLNDSMLMLATVKKVSICVCMNTRVMSYSGWMDVKILVFTRARFTWRGIFGCQDEIEKFGLEIPAEWAWFWSQGDQILVCYSANCLCMGITVCGKFSHFLERMIIRSFSFYKNILKNRKKIYIYQTIILHVLQLFKKREKHNKNKNKKGKKKDFKRLCL